ncbi:heavy metal translocating P-type ATPase metal-binding domain-containing protein, partial [Staphylococcus pasteuri_A]
MGSNKHLCFHCKEVVPAGLSLSVPILGKMEPMCCQGCAAVAQTIIDSGLEDYYKHRTAAAPSAQG